MFILKERAISSKAGELLRVAGAERRLRSSWPRLKAPLWDFQDSWEALALV